MTSPRYELLAGGERPIVVAYGATLPELFENAAYAMFDVTYDLGEIPAPHSRPVVAPGDSPEELLVNWLEELQHVARVERLALSFFTVDRLEEGGIQGSAGGLPAAEVPRSGPLVRGLATEKLNLVPIPDGWWVELQFETRPGLRSV